MCPCGCDAVGFAADIVPRRGIAASGASLLTLLLCGTLLVMLLLSCSPLLLMLLLFCSPLLTMLLLLLALLLLLLMIPCARPLAFELALAPHDLHWPWVLLMPLLPLGLLLM